ncbi:MAG: hypothetical protein RLZZ341_2252, partial [Pseudomonadota bacterium]
AEALLALLRREVDRSPPAPPVPPGLAVPSRPQRGPR